MTKDEAKAVKIGHKVSFEGREFTVERVNVGTKADFPCFFAKADGSTLYASYLLLKQMLLVHKTKRFVTVVETRTPRAESDMDGAYKVRYPDGREVWHWSHEVGAQ